MERNAARRSNAGAVITTLLSLLVVAAAVAVVAYFVLRSPDSAVDSAERLEPVGTALPAPTEQPSLPTPVPTSEPEPTVLGFTGEEPDNSGLPTVAAPVETPTPSASGPTPTPRVLALPTTAPPTAAPPPPTLPPAQATSVPVVALQPVEAAPPPTAAPQEIAAGPTPTPAPAPNDSDPLDVFGDNEPPRIVPADNEAMERVRAIQDERIANRDQRRARDDDDNGRQVDIPGIAPVAPAVIPGNGGAVEIVVPDVDAMIEEITARTIDPARNPNISAIDRDDRVRSPNTSRDDDRDDDKKDTKKRTSNRDRSNQRTTPSVEFPAIQSPSGNTGNAGNTQDCPFANLPEEQRPKDFPFGDC